MARIIFMGTPDFAVPALENLVASGQLVGVVTQPDRPAGRGRNVQPPPVKEAALAAGLPVYQPASLRRPEAAAPLREWAPDLIVVAAFGQILRPHVLDLPPLGCVNIHASLLPRWRGAAPIQYALLAGDHQTGITLMQMDAGLDTGPILVREALPIAPRETAATLHDRLAALGGRLIAAHLDDLQHRRLIPTPQDETASTYAPMIHKEDGQLNWDEPAEALDRRVRAMTPWPGAFSTWLGRQIKILAAHPAAAGGQPAAAPGTVISLGETAAVCCGHGLLIVEKLQLEGKKPLPTAEFLRGRPEFIGAHLASTAASSVQT